jgi:hypothetical protein
MILATFLLTHFRINQGEISRAEIVCTGIRLTHGIDDYSFLGFLELLNAVNQIESNFIGNYWVMFVIWMRQHEVTNQAGSCFDLSLGSC